jgi:hypothetical protein
MSEIIAIDFNSNDLISLQILRRKVKNMSLEEANDTFGIYPESDYKFIEENNKIRVVRRYAYKEFQAQLKALKKTYQVQKKIEKAEKKAKKTEENKIRKLSMTFYKVPSEIEMQKIEDGISNVQHEISPEYGPIQVFQNANLFISNKKAKKIMNFVDEVIEKYSEDWNKLVEPILSKLLENGVKIYLSDVSYFKINNVSQIIEKPTNVENFDDMILNFDITNEKINNEYIDYSINKNADNFNNIFEEQQLNSIVKTNFKENSCVFNAFLSVYAENILKLKKEKRYVDFEPTVEYLYKICFGKDAICPEKNVGISINQFKPVLDKFKLGCRVINIKNEIVYEYVPTSYNSKLNPRVFSILIHNNHAFVLNSNIKKLEQIETPSKIETDIYVSNKYKIQDKMNYSLYASTYDDLLSKIANLQIDESKEEYFRIVYNGNMKDLFYNIKFINKYEPQISLANDDEIKRINIKLNGKIVSIINPQENDNDSKIYFDGCENYFKQYVDFDFMIYSNLINKNNISKYNKDVLTIFKQTQRNAITKSFYTVNSDKKFQSIDISKAYTSNLMELEYFPKINLEDTFVPYDNHEIEDYTYYIVKINDEIATLHKIYFDKVYNRVLGLTLKKYLDYINDNQFFIDYEIVSFLRPSNLIKNNIRSQIQKLYESSLTTEHKKFIMNKNIGLLGRKKNSREINYITTSKEEAFKLFDNLEYNDDVSKLKVHPIKINEKEIWVSCYGNQTELTDGFLLISEAIYDIQRIKMFELAMKYKKLDLVAMNTDCLYFKKAFNAELQKYSNEFDKIGSIRFVEEKKNIPNKILETDKNQVKNVSNPKIKNISIKEDLWQLNRKEYEDNFSQIMNTYKLIFINGLEAGTGKSTLAKSYLKGKKHLIITPDNKLSIENIAEGFNSITLYMLFGWVVGDDKIKCKKSYDIEDIEVIFFDECMKYTTKEWNAIRNFMKENNEIQFIGAGDINQCQPIEELNNIKDWKQYYSRIRDSIFKYQINLTINKRIQTKEGQDMMKKFKTELFECQNNQDCIHVVKKYFKPIKNIQKTKGMFNIAYRNEICNMVNKQLNEKCGIEIDGLFYDVGMELICRKRLKVKSVILHTNNSYIIKSVDSNTIHLYEQLQGLNVELSTKMLKFFSLPYCYTGHISQGITTSKPMCIFDYDFYYTNKEWLYVAFSRSTNPFNVFYFDGDDVKQNKNEAFKIANKINLYKFQDKKAGRKYEESEYITIDWMKFKLNECKSICRCCKKMIDDDYSVNRIDNHLAHVKNNCEIICVNCNKTLK